MNDQPTTRATPPANEPNQTVLGGRYAIRREIARGGMATVYLAEDTLLSRPVAVKVLVGDADAGERDSFLREARAVAKLSHPNIVEVYDAGVEGTLRYIVMQFVPGGTLRDVIAREAPLDPRRAVSLTARLADALNFGHRRGIVHCDMKPGNVLLAEDGEPKIVDFGIHRSLTGTGDLSDLIVGTVGYISPEQVEGTAVDGRTDVYGLAAVLYEMLTGTPPFQGENLATVAAQRLVKPPAPPRERNPAVSEPLNDVVMRGLARDPADRYPSAKAFADALRDTLSGRTETITRRAAGPTDLATRRIAAAPAGVTEPIATGRRPAVAAVPADGVVVERPARGWLFPAITGILALLILALLVVLAVTLMDRDGGATATTVPAVTGERIDTAARRLQDAGLEVFVELRRDPAGSPPGTVIGQDPASGATRNTGDAVNVVVSSGPAAPP